MSTRAHIQQQLEQLQLRRVQLDRELERLQEELSRSDNVFESCEEEARRIAQQMDEWKPLHPPLPFPAARASLLFLGALSGEWAAQSRYRGDLPGFGGFLLVAGGINVLIDPGRTTLSNLHAAGIHPRTLDFLVATHSHWDCVRDLQLLLMAATDTHVTTARSGQARLRLLAPKSVLHGHPMDVDAVIQGLSFQRHEDITVTRRRLSEFTTMNAPALNAYDLFVRLGGRFETLDIGTRYELNPEVEVRTRPSYHHDTFGVEAIAALDIIVRRDGRCAVRCVYLSDTEYRPDLAAAYAADLDELGPIDVLICNVKTLDIRPQTEGPYLGYTRRHLGWKGLIQLTRDFREHGVLGPTSLVVLRAWGIETVTRLDPLDGVMTATPEKLRIYEDAYVAATGQPAVVPGQTWVAAAMQPDGGAPRVHHLRAPYSPKGAFRRFGTVYYCSDQMADVIRAATPAVEHIDELLLITGETGTGKDALAKSIHLEANRKGKLVIENASALSTGIGYDQLVGHSKGAFTGADSDRDGWFTEAAHGTLIIQEIGDMPIEHQIKLLTVLGERSYRRLGDHREYPLEAQIIFTTCRDVEKLMAEGQLRSELVYRFHRWAHIPPLRERLEDIRAIVHARHVDRPDEFPMLEESAITLLQSYPWPGNVRSLEHVFKRLCTSSDWSLENIRREIESEHRSTGNAVRTDNAATLDPEEHELLNLIPLDRVVRRSDLETQLAHPNKSTTINRLKRLVRKGLVRCVGRGPKASYQRVA